MQILRRMFSLRCEECGRVIKDGGYSGLGPGQICEDCHNKLEAERERVRWSRSLDWSQEVRDRVNKDFSPEEVGEVLTTLADYGKARHEDSPDFMRLAILRIANGEKERLPELVREAKLDFRDVLAEVQRKYGMDWLKEFIGEPPPR